MGRKEISRKGNCTICICLRKTLTTNTGKKCAWELRREFYKDSEVIGLERTG